MSDAAVDTGTCPVCGTEQPLIWDGTVQDHGSRDNPLLDCPGSFHAPVDVEHVHACRCGARWES